MIFFLFFLSIVKDLLLDLRNSMFMKAQFVSPLYNVDILQLLGIKRYNRRKMQGHFPNFTRQINGRADTSMQGPYSFLSPMAFGTAYLLIFLIHA